LASHIAYIENKFLGFGFSGFLWVTL